MMKVPSKVPLRQKIDTHGILFRTWALFAGFSAIILLLLWALQWFSLRPYYRSVKVSAVQNIAAEITSALLEDNEFAKTITDLTYKNNVCLALYNDQYQRVSSMNALGLGCYIADHAETSYDAQAYLNEIASESSEEIYHYATDERFRDESLIYGTKINAQLGTYYLIINAAVEPVDSTVFIMQNQFVIAAFIVLFISVVIAYLLSRTYAKPVQSMTESAQRLAVGDYQVAFQADSFTEINALANTLNYATKELSKTEELRRDLLANVSHDIKTPLTTIKAYAEMIKDISGNIPEKRDNHLDVIISEANHLDKLVNDMMVLTKVQSGNMTLNATTFDLVLLAQEIIAVLNGTAENMGICIENELPEVAMIYADRTLIGQVIYNFLNNAIKHAGSDHKVFVKIVPQETGWYLAIEDHGCGIKKEEIPYIWDRYYKIDKKYQRNQEGSGLGLAISKAYLELHGYSFGVKSKEEEGTTFWFVCSYIADNAQSSL